MCWGSKIPQDPEVSLEYSDPMKPLDPNPTGYPQNEMGFYMPVLAKSRKKSDEIQIFKAPTNPNPR